MPNRNRIAVGAESMVDRYDTSLPPLPSSLQRQFIDLYQGLDKSEPVMMPSARPLG